MVPPPKAYNWSNVYGIEFKFQSDNNPREHLKYQPFFTSDANDEGPRTLGPAPVTALREAFCKTITLDMANIDELAKGHIAQLLDSCPVRFVKPGFPNQRIRNPQDFDSAGREAVRRAEATNDPEPLATVLFNINQWKFKRNWKTNDPANYFNGIYTYNNATLTVPITHVESEAHPAIQVPSSCVASSSATSTGLLTNKMIHSDVVDTPSNTTASIPPVTANLGPLQPVGKIADTPSVKAPRYTWTWTYSPHSESVLFRRVCSDSFLCVTSSSPPVHRATFTIVTAPSDSPSAPPRLGHHSAPPWKPTNFVWTFNPQNEIATFRRVPKSVPSPQPPMCNLLLPPDTLAEDTDLPNAAPAYIQSLRSPCRNQPVLRLTKRHRDALKIKTYHLYATILSMNWFYATID
eukprot:jgi/Psemu1/13317/gm1.13317_g